MDADLIVIGGGAAGLVAAREAARRGARTVLVADGPLGGDCTHTGCVPSKTLLTEAARGKSFLDAMATVRDRVATIAATEDAEVLRSEGIEVVEGRARLVGSHQVAVGGLTMRSPRIILATGAGPALPAIPGLAAEGILTNENLFALDRLPRRLAVLGGGAIGVEMAQAFSQLGSNVTLIEGESRLLPREEPEASIVITTCLERVGTRVLAGVRVEGVEHTQEGAVLLCLDDGTRETADAVLVATGRAPTTDGLGLVDAGVERDDRGFVVTDDTMATTVKGIWAIGDVTGTMPFTHAATRMAFVAVGNALARRALPRTRFERAAVPWVTFTDPEVARVGMTETEAAARGGRVAHLPFTELDRAVIAGATDGFVKLIAGPRRGLGNIGGGRILGATIVAPSGGEMIGEVALAMHTRAFTGRLAQSTHAYPTWSMAIQQAAAQFFMSYQGRTARPARADAT